MRQLRHAVRCLLSVASVVAPVTGWSATPIYRSVGVGPSVPLVSSTGTLTIAGTLATFSAPLPDRIGVGDAIEYDSDGNGLLDALAFIHGRAAVTPGRVYSVRSASGAPPVPTYVAATQWSVFRAYTSLDNATRGIENAGIGAAVRDFDSAINGKDLVAADETWNIACYDDGVDTTTAALCSVTDPPALESCTAGGNNGWRTDATHIIHVYTPVGLNEVGASQRHDGRWGTGYRRTAGLLLHGGFFWVDGLSVMTNNLRCYLITATGAGGWVRVSNSFGWQTCTACPNMRAFDVWSESIMGPTQSRIELWNDIGVADDTGDPNGAVFYLNSRQAVFWLHNCTGVSLAAGYVFRTNNADLVTARNCLGVAATSGNAFSPNARWVEVSTSASNDPSVLTVSSAAQTDFSAGVFPNQAFMFVDAGSLDFHLAGGDVGARRRGANLSANPELPLADDIDGDPRPAGTGTWDIGADQLVVDSGLGDGGFIDGGSVDAGSVDGGSVDAGSVDAGSVDAGSVDAGVGGQPGGRVFTVGCGCDGSAVGPLMVALAAALGRLGRRRSSRCPGQLARATARAARST